MPAVPKPQHDRGAKLRRNHTRITNSARAEVKRRADGFCERCGKFVLGRGGEVAHLDGAAQLGCGDQPWNLVLLCGPSNQTGTCHWFIDSRKKSGGSDWSANKRAELMEQYGVEICTPSLCGAETIHRDASGAPICDNCIDLYPERMQAGYAPGPPT